MLGCMTTPEVEAEGRNAGECSDAADNDGDGLFDCGDPDCEGSPDCTDDYGPTGTPTPTPTAETADSSAETGDTGAPVDPRIVAATVECIDDEQVRFELEVKAGDRAFAYSQETANSEPQLAEDHPLTEIEPGTFAVSLATGGSFPATPGVTSSFRCDTDKGGGPFHHRAGHQVMTYLFRLYDGKALADCVVIGEDPVAVLTGTHEVVLVPAKSDPNEVVPSPACRVITLP